MSSALLLLVVLANHVVCDSQSPLIAKDGGGGMRRHIRFYSITFPVVTAWTAIVFGVLPWLTLAVLGVGFHAVVDLSFEYLGKVSYTSPANAKMMMLDQAFHAVTLILAFLAMLAVAS